MSAAGDAMMKRFAQWDREDLEDALDETFGLIGELIDLARGARLTPEQAEELDYLTQPAGGYDGRGPVKLREDVYTLFDRLLGA